ncbi:MAG: hypothetical protein SAK29_21920 [Scytonema sp. PMC 1069.18]|nr:hypothetical protein [Scytonema sp. PMC 1069.18]MEC4885342.1 hypothetical protein [Scytonema sp. PMC 1070.18]
MRRVRALSAIALHYAQNFINSLIREGNAECTHVDSVIESVQHIAYQPSAL